MSGILHDLVRQNMTDMILQSLPHIVAKMEAAATFATTTVGDDDGVTIFYNVNGPSASPSTGRSRGREPMAFRPNLNRYVATSFKDSPIAELLQLVLHSDIKVLEFSKNKNWPETERLPEVARALWKIVGNRCPSLR